MKGKTLFICVMILVLSMFMQCKPVGPPEEDSLDSASELKEIPAEYGKLIAVTTVDLYPHWAQLWFEDEQNTIRMVRVQWTQKLQHKVVLTIQRD